MIDVKRLAVDAGYWDECGAPEGATHYGKDAGFFCNKRGYWNDDGDWRRLDQSDNGWGTKRYIPRPKPHPEWDDCSPPDWATHYCESHKAWRNSVIDFIADCCIPLSQPQPEWVDGLPPVGAKVEVWVPNVGCWDEVSVLAIDVDTVIWRNGTDRASYIGTHIDNVRPIPTPEQRQREELIDLIGKQRPTIAELAEAILSRYTLELKS